MVAEKIKCIYTITNTLNGKYYVGSSLNVKKRISGHLNDLRKRKHHCTHLQNAWNKYGEENFKIELVLKLNHCEDYIVREIEQEILDKEFENLYNSSKSSIGPKTEQERINLSKSREGKLNHNFGKEIHVRRKSGSDIEFNKKSNKWRACISVQKHTIHLGCFDTEIEALEARLAAEKIYWAKDYVHIKKPICVPLNYKKKGKKFEAYLRHKGKVYYKMLNNEIEAYEYIKILREELGITY